jgi:hypothetical protein
MKSALAAAALIIAGCAAAPHEKPAQTALEQNRHAECAALYTQALDEFRGISARYSEQEGKHWDGEEGIQRTLYGRARCRKGAGDIKGALADLDGSIKKMEELSHIKESWVLTARRAAMADMVELRAKWIKGTEAAK